MICSMVNSVVQIHSRSFIYPRGTSETIRNNVIVKVAQKINIMIDNRPIHVIGNFHLLDYPTIRPI